jgi:hypothetical protein
LTIINNSNQDPNNESTHLVLSASLSARFLTELHGKDVFLGVQISMRLGGAFNASTRRVWAGVLHDRDASTFVHIHLQVFTQVGYVLQKHYGLSSLKVNIIGHLVPTMDIL